MSLSGSQTFQTFTAPSPSEGASFTGSVGTFVGMLFHNRGKVAVNVSRHQDLVMRFDLREGFVHVYVLVKIARVLDHLLRQSIFLILADASEGRITVEKPF